MEFSCPRLIACLRTAALVLAALFLTTAAAAAPASAVEHPRLLAGGGLDREALKRRIAQNPEARRAYESILKRVTPHVERHVIQPDWIVSRLQMYWQSHATDVYFKNALYASAEGRAPVPTVRFAGARDSVTVYLVPALEDIKPYMGEGDKLWLQNRSAPGKPWEWADQAKTGGIIQAINQRILQLADEAAFIYWYGGDERYARFAFDILDTYLPGMYYRKEPVDLARGHGQNLVGLQTFEVIHEDMVGPVAEAYDFLWEYIDRKAPKQRALYDTALKKWADVIIRNGVPFNNWNLIEARFVLQIAAVLRPNASYEDGRGDGYYVDQIVNGDATRQWSLKRLAGFGYDEGSATWFESPGYSINVAGDYTEIAELLDEVFGVDLIAQLPIIARAVSALPQYLLPNGRTVGFGDTHYDPLRSMAFARLAADGLRHGRQEQARDFSEKLAAVQALAPPSLPAKLKLDDLHTLFERERPQLRPEERAAAPSIAPSIARYQTPVFYAPNSSWLIQRSGNDPSTAVAISQVGSAGNHAHANGIAMELFAQGLNIVPEGGIGTSYFQQDYAEYYSQFPAHNTVVVNGISSYPAMRSNHPFSLLSAYPAPGSSAPSFDGIRYSEVSFVEPETQSDQTRLMSIVRIDAQTAYFVDIFRSRQRSGSDRYHDYLFHGLGQSMSIGDASGKQLVLSPSERLTFAEGDLVGYDAWWDKRSVRSDKDFSANFKLSLPGEKGASLRLWMKGQAEREIFSVKAPRSTAWSPGMLPEAVAEASLPTLVVRQSGEAWNRPFAAIIEASAEAAAPRIVGISSFEPKGAQPDFVGLQVSTKGGGRQTLYSSVKGDHTVVHDEQRATGRYAVIAERSGRLESLFIGDGHEVADGDYAIVSMSGALSAALSNENGAWFYTASAPAQLIVPVGSALAKKQLRLVLPAKVLSIAGKREEFQGRSAILYEMPAVERVRLD